MSRFGSSIVNTVVGSPNALTGQVEYRYYGYNPNAGVCLFFVIAFSLSLWLHLGQAIRYKIWWLLYTLVIGIAGEIIGWAGRTASHYSQEWVSTGGGYFVSSRNAFIIQICCLIFSPAFIQAALYLCLGLIISKIGVQYSYVKPRAWTVIFLTADIICILVQCMGGAIAGSATSLNRIKLGSNIMLAGIVIQMAIMGIFTLLLIDFLRRYLKDRPLKKYAPGSYAPRDSFPLEEQLKAQRMIWAVLGADVFVFIRSIFRTVELASGWSGYVMESEPLFSVFDALMVLLAICVLNVFHPGRLIGARRILKGADLKQPSSSGSSDQEKV